MLSGGYWDLSNPHWVGSTGHAEGGITSQPSHGALTQIDTGDYWYDDDGNIGGQFGLAFTYLPEEGFIGTDSFTYAIHDDGGTSTGTVFIRVNVPPTAPSDGPYTTDEDTPLTIDAASLLTDATDADNDPLTAALIDPPANGDVYLNEDGSFTYVPAANFNGTDSFVYVATDGVGSSSAATATITVNPLNDGPTATDISFSFDSSLQSTFSLTADAGLLTCVTDPEGDSFTITPDSQPAHGSLVLNADGSFTYTPNHSYAGADSFTFHATDDSAAAGNIATVTFTVANTRDIAPDALTTNDTALQLAYTITGGAVNPFSVALFTSTDGITPDQFLQSIDAVDLTAGSHTLTISPTFDDPQEDYYLVAVVDYFDETNETDETNNTVAFAGGAFLLYEPSLDQYTTVFIATSNDVISVVASTDDDNNEAIDLIFRDPSLGVTVASDPDNGYLDVNGDGVIDGLDALAVADNTAGVPSNWQNPANRFDTDHDGYVSAQDVLALVNEYNAQGYHSLTPTKPSNRAFLDVSGDFYFSQLDIDQWWKHYDGSHSNTESWQNTNPFDANDDGTADAADAQTIDDYLNNNVTTTTTTLPTTATTPGDTVVPIAGLTIHGGPGDDKIVVIPPTITSTTGLTAPPFITIHGGDGNDIIIAGTLGDLGAGLPTPPPVTIFGDAGDDTIFGTPGDDTLDGGEGNDTIHGDPGNDVTYGGDGDDKMDGGEGDDEMHGGDGDDDMHGGPGNDWLWGDNGNDHLDGQEGNDELYGGAGANSLSDASGNNSLSPDGEYLPALVGYTPDIPDHVEGDVAQIRFFHLPGGGMQAVTLTVVVLDGDAHGEDLLLNPARIGVDTEGPTVFIVHIPEGENSVSEPISIQLKHDDIIEPVEYYWIHIAGVLGGGYAPPPYDWADYPIFDASIEAADDVAVVTTGDPVEVDVLLDDYAALNQPLHISSFTQPEHGTVRPICFNYQQGEFDPTCNSGVIIRLTYQRDEDYADEDEQFEYTAEDQFGQTSDANVFLAIAPYRRVIGLTSDKGPLFWEGDTVTFTASLTSNTPGANESFTWESRYIRLVTRSGQIVYSDWTPLAGAGSAASATYTFNDPFRGQVRVTLSSGGTTSSKTTDVTAKAAYPTNFRPVSHSRIGNHLVVFYKWDSSSTRLADLDNVEMGEFVWETQRGYDYGRTCGPGCATLTEYFFKDPFSGKFDDGYYMALASVDVIAGQGADTHSGVTVLRGKVAAETQHQYYWYKILDGFNYWKETEFGETSSTQAGDPIGEQRLREATIRWLLLQTSASSWTLRIDKGADGSVDIPIPSFPFLAE